MSLRQLRHFVNYIVSDNFPNTDVEIKIISNDGSMFTSFLCEVKVFTPEETLDLFVKVAASPNLEHAFAIENFIYSKLPKVYERLQNIHGLTDQRFEFPKFYKSRADKIQTIMLENLVRKGYKRHDRLKSVDWKYASKSIETLAKFHALSFAFGKKYPEEYKYIEDVFKLHPMLTHPEWKGLADGALAVLNEAEREKLSKLLEGSMGWSKLKELGDPRNTPVIIHGDYGVKNLMYREMNNELTVIPVDYQCSRIGCPVSDLIYFIVLGTDQQFRRQYYHQLVDHYYQELVLAVSRLGLEPGEVYGREEFEDDMKAKLPLGLCVAAMGLPFGTMDPTEAATFENGWFVPSSNELFVERFRGLFDDFIKWGFI